MDATSPLLSSLPAAQIAPASSTAPASRALGRTALLAGAGVATASLGAIGAAATLWQTDGHLPLYAAEAVCGVGLGVSLYQLQRVRRGRERLAQVHSQNATPHFDLGIDKAALTRSAGKMAGMGAVLGAASVGVALVGTSMSLSTYKTLVASGIGLFNFGLAAAHFTTMLVPPAPAETRGRAHARDAEHSRHHHPDAASDRHDHSPHHNGHSALAGPDKMPPVPPLPHGLV